MKRFYSTLPGLSLTPRLLLCKEQRALRTDRHNGGQAREAVSLTAFTSTTHQHPLQAFLPQNIRQREWRLHREERLHEAQMEARKIRRVDGTSMSLLDPAASRRPRRQLQVKIQEKRNVQISTRQLRMRERIQGILLVVLSTVIRDAHLQLPVWRLTRTQLSPDYRHALCHWTIDEEGDRERYGEGIGRALERVSNTVRYELGKRLSLGFTPTVRFQYEDYRAIELERSLQQQEAHLEDATKGSDQEEGQP